MHARVIVTHSEFVMHHGFRSILAMLLLAGVGGSRVLGQSTAGAAPAAGPREMDLSAYQGPKGKLAIRAVQGTKSAPAAGADEAELILFHNNAPVKRYPLHLDELGMTVVGDLPIALGLRPMVRIKHAGVFYQQLGEPLDTAKPNASIEVVVFEVTDKVPAWKVVLRQMMLDRKNAKDGGAIVAETVIVDNPADATWLGNAPDEMNRRATVRLTLPVGASDIQLEQGFHGWCCTSIKGSELNIQMPLMPGKMTYQFAYSVPAKEGKVDLRMSAPAPIEHAAVYVPEQEQVAETTILAAAGSEMVAGQSSRLYQAMSLKAGDTAGLVVLAPAVAAPVQSSASSNPTVFWTSIVGGVLAVGLVGFVFARRVLRK